MSLQDPSSLTPFSALSEHARYLSFPDTITTTDWPWIEKVSALLGIEYEPWQQELGTLITAHNATGAYASSIDGATISICRQAGKTYLVSGICFALSLARPNSLILWTAHHNTTSAETFRDLNALTSSPKIAPYLLKPTRSPGRESINFRNGSRIKFGARDRGFGRGLHGVDLIVFDEAQILTQRSIDSMLPTMNRSKNALYILTGTPPHPTDPSEVFSWRRKKALQGTLEKGLYIEFSADEGSDPDDKTQWAKANPSYPAWTTDEAFERLRSALDPYGFQREALGIWDDGTPHIPPLIDASRWSALTGKPPANPGLVCYGVKFSADGDHVGLAVGVRTTGGDTGGPVHIEVIEERPVADGLTWLVEWLAQRWETAAHIVIDGRAGAGILASSLRQAGVGKTAILQPAVQHVIDAHALMLDLVGSSGLTHAAQPGLDAEVARAVKRTIGRLGGWGWESLTGEPVVGLEAATLAAWSAMTTTRYDDETQGGGHLI